MATAQNDVKNRIAMALNDQVLADAVDAQKTYSAKVLPFREAYGQTVDVDEDQWRKLTGDSKRDLAPMTQQRMIKLGAYLWESNLLANRIIELPIAFMLAEGVAVTASDPGVQATIDRFWNDPINQMDLKLPKKARELAIFGEQCWPSFVNQSSGTVRLGYLDPAVIATVVTDPDNPEQPIGVITNKDSKGNARRYKVIVNGAESDLFTERTQAIRETFDTGECFFFSINTLGNGSRGRSDLLPQIDWLDAYEQVLFGEIDRMTFLRSFLWDVTLKGATPDEVAAKAKTIRPPSPGSVRVHNDSEVWTAESPDLNSTDTTELSRMFRNHVLGGATQPEHWFGGGGDVNRATAGEMGEPTFKVMAMRQTLLKHILLSVITYVIRQEELAVFGKEPDMMSDEYAFEVAFPEMVSRDLSKYATALTQVTMGVAQAINLQLMTRERGLQIIERISSRLGVEFDTETELAAATAEAAKSALNDVFTTATDTGGA